MSPIQGVMASRHQGGSANAQTLPERPKHLHRLRSGRNVVHPEYLRPPCHARRDAGVSAGVAILGIRLLQHLDDDGHARDRQQNGAPEATQALQIAVNSEVVVALLGEVDAGIHHHLPGPQSC